MPQHAVTNGYWKIEYFRAQPMASSSRLVKNPPHQTSQPTFSIAIPARRYPMRRKTGHEHAQEDDDLGQTQHTEIAEHDRPRVQEDELDVEQDEENRGQVEPD